jgi:hypothetical protein
VHLIDLPQLTERFVKDLLEGLLSSFLFEFLQIVRTAAVLDGTVDCSPQACLVRIIAIPLEDGHDRASRTEDRAEDTHESHDCPHYDQNTRVMTAQAQRDS